MLTLNGDFNDGFMAMGETISWSLMGFCDKKDNLMEADSCQRFWQDKAMRKEITITRIGPGG